MTTTKRRIGLEQEFFLVNAQGELVHQADECLVHCHHLAEARDDNPRYFVPEFVKSMVEVNTPPAYSVTELARFYLQNLDVTFALEQEGPGTLYLRRLKENLPFHETIEDEFLKVFLPTSMLSREDALRLVLECCDRLEKQVIRLNDDDPFTVLDNRFS